MTEKNLKFFNKDRILRDKSGRPIGRAVLASNYVIGANIPIAVLTVPKAFFRSLKSVVFYVDKVPYKIPDDLPKSKLSHTIDKIMVNNFYLERTDENSINE